MDIKIDFEIPAVALEELRYLAEKHETSSEELMIKFIKDGLEKMKEDS